MSEKYKHALTKLHSNFIIHSELCEGFNSYFYIIIAFITYLIELPVYRISKRNKIMNIKPEQLQKYIIYTQKV